MTIAPEITPELTVTRVTVFAADLRRVLANALLFTSADRTLPVLCAVQLSSDGATLTAAATDRYTLGSDTAKLDLDNGDVTGFEVLIDRADIPAVVKFLKDKVGAGQPVTLTVHESHVSIAIGVLSVTASTVYGTFPKWRSLFPSTTPPIERQMFNPAFMAKFAKVITSERHTPMRLEFSRPTKVTIGDTFIGLIMPVHDKGY